MFEDGGSCLANNLTFGKGNAQDVVGLIQKVTQSIFDDVVVEDVVCHVGKERGIIGSDNLYLNFHTELSRKVSC